MTRFLLTFICLSLYTASWAATSGSWSSVALGKAIKYKTTEASKPAKDASGNPMTVVYLTNLAIDKVGRNSNADDVAWLLEQGYRVIELDYEHDAQAVSPQLNLDIIAINKAMQAKSFGGCTKFSDSRCYVLFEGYRIQRDVSYYLDDPTVYNFPDDYARTSGDSLYMDLVYPANPRRAVPTMVTFSYSNSYATSGGAATNKHKRMYLPYFWGAFSDSFVEGCAALGMAWAICDHPKYCDWGQGKYPGGANKSLGALEVNPDALSKVQSAIRTVRGVGKTLGLSDEVMVTGFSRGSTAASLAIAGVQLEGADLSRGRFPSERVDVSCAVLGPGIFDYQKMTTTTNEYTRMAAYVKAFPQNGWAIQGGLCLVASELTAPCLLYHNTDDDANYVTQANALQSRLKELGVKCEVLRNYGTGHSVPQSVTHLQQMYDFVRQYIPNGPEAIENLPAETATPGVSFDLCGRSVTPRCQPHGFCVDALHRKYYVE